MIRIKIEEIIFKPKFECSLSILAKICNKLTIFRRPVIFNYEINTF
jgi:hypothetical protein